jgi:hypothetical protein
MWLSGLGLVGLWPACCLLFISLSVALALTLTWIIPRWRKGQCASSRELEIIPATLGLMVIDLRVCLYNENETVYQSAGYLYMSANPRDQRQGF